ncbi:unnamed protein product, partial [marine sediment metagenome]
EELIEKSRISDKHTRDDVVDGGTGVAGGGTGKPARSDGRPGTRRVNDGR